MNLSKSKFILISMIVCFIFDTACAMDVPTCISHLQRVYGNFNQTKGKAARLQCSNFALLNFTVAEVSDKEDTGINLASRTYYNEFVSEGKYSSTTLKLPLLFCNTTNATDEYRIACNNELSEHGLNIVSSGLKNKKTKNTENKKAENEEIIKKILGIILRDKKIMYTTDENGKEVEDPNYKYTNKYIREAAAGHDVHNAKYPLAFCKTFAKLKPTL